MSKLALLRLQANLTQESLAAAARAGGAVNFSASEISAAEGGRRNLSFRKLRQLAPALSSEKTLDGYNRTIAEIALDQALAEIAEVAGPDATRAALCGAL